jgi:universal stress protein A
MNRRITHILVPTDLGPTSDAAVDYAIRIARRFSGTLHFLHVVDDPLAAAAPWGSEAYIAGIPALRDALVDEAAVKLAAVLKQAERRGVPARSEIRLGGVAEVIRDFAKAEGCDLIVMGTHGRTGIAHLLRGSVAEKTVRQSACPVLTVPTEDKANEGERVESELACTA